MNKLKCLALVPTLMLIAAAGCIKRSETITIFEDGRLRLAAEIKGDPDDVYNGDAMPTAESGWQMGGSDPRRNGLALGVDLD